MIMKTEVLLLPNLEAFFIDSSTGQINPQNSSPGTYDVFYTIGASTGCAEITGADYK